MNEDRKRVLAMLAEGKITTEEAERLLAALERGSDFASQGAPRPVTRSAPRFLRVEVDAKRPDRGPAKVNIRVPMMLLRSGVRLSALMPAEARDEINAAMKRKGMTFDINQLRPENLEAMLEQIGELTVDVTDDRAHVRIYCE